MNAGSAVFSQIPNQTRAGAPGRGSGSLTVGEIARVIDGDTFEVMLNGNRIGVGILGVTAPQGNTVCGQQTTQVLEGLLTGKKIVLEEDLDLTFDSRKRRMYYVNINGKSLAKELVKAGWVKVRKEGKEQDDLKKDEDKALSSAVGCVWDAAKSQIANLTDAILPINIAPKQVFNEKAASAELPSAALLPTGFSSVAVATGLSYPTDVAWLPDGRILIAEKSGIVRLVKNGVLQPTPFIDLRSRVNSYWDHGLLSIAVDSNFATNKYVYMLYTFENDAVQYNSTKTSRLTRVTAAGDTASPSTETVLLGTVTGSSCKLFPVGADCLSSDSPSHSIGSVRVASDGTLFVTSGEGANFNVVDDDALRAQNLDLLNGKVLHITTSGAGVAGNPFWNGSASANRSKIWALGLRNPYRMNLRPGTLIPYVGDVGWSDWEEVNVASAGANFGWPCYEGVNVQGGYSPKPVCQALYAQGSSAVRNPLVVYNHNSISSAATGGAFYTGNVYPAEYQGAYFYGDYAQNFIRYIKVNSSNVMLGSPKDFLFNADGPVSIQMGPDGYLYVVSINSGELRRITYSGTADVVPPTITSIGPANNATDVPVSTSITVTFSELIDSSSINGSTFTLTKQGASQPAVSSITYEGSQLKATLSSGLEPGVIYTAVVKGGPTGVKDSAGNPLNNDRVWSFTTSLLPAGTTYLSERAWTSATNGWGPVELNQSNGDQAAGDGNPLKLNSVIYAKGLGVHANSEIHYALGSNCSSFSTDVGVDAEVGVSSLASVVFQVWADGVKLFDSGVMNGPSPTQSVTVPLTGRNELVLIMNDAGDNNYSDHGDWANARLTCTGGSGPPAVTTTTPSDGATGVAITTPINVTFSQAMNAASITSTTLAFSKQGNPALPTTVTYDTASRTAQIKPTNGLEPGVVYSIVVQGGPGGVADATGVSMAANKTWSFSTASLPAGTSYLSDRNWTSSTNGWGPVEKDRDNGETGTGDGLPITLNGVVYPKGLGTHANADVRYNITGCSSFTSDIGVDDIVGTQGSVVFQVWLDGVKQYDSGTMMGATPTKSINLSLIGKTELRLVVTDAGNGNGYDHADWANAQVVCGVSNTAPTVTITSPLSSNLFKVGDVISFAGSATDPEDGTIPDYGLSWQIILHHCQGSICHIHPFLTTTGFSGNFTVPDHGDSIYFEIILTATDSGGLTSQKTVTIQPQTTQVTLVSTPTGLEVVFSGSTVTAPSTHTVVVGSVVTIGAPSPQDQYTFSSWSDGGAQQHTVVAGASNATYTVTFNTADTTVPTVTSVSPVGGATSIATNASISATFSEALQSATVTASTVTLIQQGTTTAIPATVSYNNTTRRVTVTPSSPLSSGSSYTATIKGGASGVKDVAGNALAADYSWTFGTAGGTTAPIVTVNTPATGATGVDVGAVVSATFSKAMQAASLTTGTVTLVKQGTATSIPAAVAYNSSTNTVTLTPSAALASSTTFTATIEGGANGAMDVSGTPLAANYVWSFTTGGDTTPPAVTANTPAAGATGVPVSTVVTATFSEAVLAASLTNTTVTLTAQGSATPVTASVSYNSTTHIVTLTPSADLATSTLYTVTIKGGTNGVSDSAGNTMASDFVWTFTTVADTTAPTVTTTTPAGNATAVAVNAVVTATFSETMQTASITSSTVTLLKQGTATPVTAAISYNSSTSVVTLTPSAALSENSTYTVTIKGGASGVKDLTANPMAADYTWSFTTVGDTVAPTVTSTNPITGATGVTTNVAITAAFSEAMQVASLTTSTVTLTRQGDATPVTAAISYNSTTQVATLTPSSALSNSSTYTALIKGGASGVKDLAGNALAADYQWTFTTAAQATTTTYLSDRTWLTASNGWGPVEKDRANGDLATGDGAPLKLNGVSYTKGLGVHANADIRYAISGCSGFTTYMGVDDEVGNNGSVVFQIWLDGIKQYDSGTMTGATAAKNTTVSLTGKSELRLVVTDAGNGADFDHADWADAQITCGSDTTPPTVASSNPVSDATAVPTNSSISAVFSEAMQTASLNTSTITLVKQGTPTAIPATVAYTVASNTVTLTPSSSLTPATTYTVTIKSGASGVKDLAGNPLATDYLWSFTTDTAVTSYLSDRNWTSATNGWGSPEKDRANGDMATGDGAPLTLNGVVYPKGVGVHANADIRYNIAGCSSFTSLVGVDDEVGSNGSVVFQIWLDGVKQYDSGVMTGASAAKTATVSLTGKSQLRLVVTDNGDGVNYDHGDWAGAQLTCSSDTAAPTITARTPAPNATAIPTNSVVTATFSEAMLASSITTSTVTLLKQGVSTPVAAAVSYNAATNVVTLTPSAALSVSSIYTVTIKGASGGVSDLSGNTLAANSTWSFTTSSTLASSPSDRLRQGDFDGREEQSRDAMPIRMLYARHLVSRTDARVD